MNNHEILKNSYFFAKKASQVVMKLKSELLDQKSLTSPTCSNFEIFDHDLQLDIKFLKPITMLVATFEHVYK